MNIQHIKLKIKLKSLAEEARIIRKEERRLKLAGRGPDITQLHEHRLLVVRRCARETHIAYGYLRGLSYEQIERPKRAPNWDNVEKIVKKYGTVQQENDFQSWTKLEHDKSQAA